MAKTINRDDSYPDWGEFSIDNIVANAAATPEVDEVPNYNVPFKHETLFKIKPGESSTVPILRIVFILVGSHGDVRPYVAFGLRLKQDGHLVRIATHAHHKNFVLENGLDFYTIAGDPKDLMNLMSNTLDGVKQKTDAFVQHRQWIKDLCTTAYEACTTKYDLSFVNKEDIDESEDQKYRVDVLLANPPAFPAYHIADKLCVPLVMTFTMPWTPTSEFLPPIVSKSAATDIISVLPFTFRTHFLLDRGIWVGMRDIINEWRENDLKITPIRNSLLPGFNRRGHRLLYDNHIPYIYCFSEELIKRPADWAPWIKIADFFFLKQASNYKSSEAFDNFIENPPVSPEKYKPVYIGFGSIVIANAAEFVDKLFAAIHAIREIEEYRNLRFIIQDGWSKLDSDALPENVFQIGSAPHDWLFPHCSVVVHHGGAGTTSTGISEGKPTIIIPFFGDQFFWGEIVAKREVGQTIRFADFTPEKFVAAIQYCLQETIVTNAGALGETIKNGDGVEKAFKLFSQCIPIPTMQCHVCDPELRHLAVIYCDSCNFQLCESCDQIIHSCVGGNGDHKRRDHHYIEYGTSSPSALYHKVTSLHAGFHVFEKEIAGGFIGAVDSISSSEGNKIANFGKGIGSVFKGVASAVVGGGVKTLTEIATTPDYVQKQQQNADKITQASLVGQYDEETISRTLDFYRAAKERQEKQEKQEQKGKGKKLKKTKS